MPEKYLRRVIDERFENQLNAFGAICLRGPKWCGKTTTASRYAKSRILMQGKDAKAYLKAADTDLSLILDGPTPRLIDEWQEYPQIWDSVRYEVDERNDVGQFILTGSSAPKEGSMKHSGAGRFGFLDMYPMSLFESGESNGTVSLRDLFSGTADLRGATTELTVRKLAECICRGGWPQATKLNGEDALVQSYDYVDAVVREDINRADGIQRDETRVRLLLRSYARHQGSAAPYPTIRDDIKANDSMDLSEDTIMSYIKALKRIFVVEDCEAWSPNLRSKTAIRTSDTRYFVDPSIATAALGVGPGDLINDLNTCGLLFETLCMRDLRVFADFLQGEVRHFRTKEGLECDAVVHLRNGSYGLIEIKLGGDKLIEEGAETLKAVRDKIDTTKMKNPSFLMVLTGNSPFAYRREDGVYVVPIGCLRQ